LEEIEIFEEEEDADVGQDAQAEEPGAFFSFDLFEEECGCIINNNQVGKNEDVGRDECYVEDAAGNEQYEPFEALRGEEVEGSDNWKEEKE
jgi:hypothetical protein